MNTRWNLWRLLWSQRADTYNQNARRHMRFLATIALSGLLLSPVVKAETLYVSDELKVAMRSGATNGHRIIKFIPSGTRLRVLGESENGNFKQVEIEDGKQGWVETSNLVASPSARSRLPGLNRKISNLNSKLQDSQAEVRELKQQLSVAEQRSNKLDAFGKQKSDELESLRQRAARPLQLAQQKEQLQDELKRVQGKLDMALADNTALRDSSIKEWFLIGGGVSLISLFAGLIIPSIRWRKKDSWSNNF